MLLGDVDHHGDRDAFALELGRFDPPLRPGERDNNQDQDQRTQPRQGAGASGQAMTVGRSDQIAERGKGHANRRGAPSDPPQQQRHQQQKQQRLGIGQPHHRASRSTPGLPALMMAVPSEFALLDVMPVRRSLLRSPITAWYRNFRRGRHRWLVSLYQLTICQQSRISLTGLAEPPHVGSSCSGSRAQLSIDWADHVRLELARDAHPGRVRDVGSCGRRADPDAASAEHGLDPGRTASSRPSSRDPPLRHHRLARLRRHGEAAAGLRPCPLSRLSRGAGRASPGADSGDPRSR